MNYGKARAAPPPSRHSRSPRARAWRKEHPEGRTAIIATSDMVKRRKHNNARVPDDTALVPYSTDKRAHLSRTNGKNHVNSMVHRRFQDQQPTSERLFPDDCYEDHVTWATGHMPNRPRRQVVNYLKPEAPDDLVARVENAILAGFIIPEHFNEADLYISHVPNRRIVAFAYATLRPEIGDRFSKACRHAEIPGFTVNQIYQSMESMMFLSQFWRERVKAQSGIVMLYADRYARAGSPQHLKMLAEMTGESQEKPTRHEHTHVTMPADPSNAADAVAAATPINPAADMVDLEEEPR